MSQAVARTLGRYAVREVRVGDCGFDVVSYNKKDKTFHVVECKMSKSASGIGQTFGQLAAYSATIAEQRRNFIINYSKKLDVPMHQGRWMEATDDFRNIKVGFYVALTDRACKRVGLLRAIKKLLPDVGIIRVKQDGYCRFHVWDGKRKDKELALPRVKSIKLLRNPSE